MMKFEDFYPQILNTLRSNTLRDLSDEELEQYLFEITMRAIAAFKFPKIVPLYKVIDGEYYFNEGVGYEEFNVLLVLIKYYWLERQLDDENHYVTTYFDKNVKLHSKANLIDKLVKRIEIAKQEVKNIQYEYSRMKEHKPTIGGIYE